MKNSMLLRSRLTTSLVLLSFGLVNVGQLTANGASDVPAQASIPSDVWAQQVPVQEYFVRVRSASRQTTTFLTDYSNLGQGLQSYGATLDLQLVGTSNLYLRFKMPGATLGDRQTALENIEKLPLVAQLVSAAAANLLIKDYATLTSYPANVTVPENTLRGFRPKRAAAVPTSTQPHVNRILVKYLQSASYTSALLASAEQTLAALTKQLGTSLYGHIATRGDTPFDVIAVPTTVDFNTALLAYQNSPVVEYAQPDYIYSSSTSTYPNDPAFSGTNYSTSDPNMWNMYQIDAGDAWGTYTYDASGVVVAVLDTGINYNHDDLSANLWPYANSGADCGFNEVGGSTPLDDMSSEYHGTHVSGIIGAVGNNDFDGAGVCWDVQLMAVKVLDSSGSGTDDEIIDGIEDAINNGANVANMSFGQGADSSDTALTSEYKSLAENNVVVAKAAGNNSSNHDSWTYLGDNDSYLLPSMLYVAATDDNDDLATFSDYGQYSVDVAAPGVNIWSTWGGNDTDMELLSGTSMATPMVAGVAALARSYYPDETAADIADRVRFGADYESSISSDVWSQGRLNAYKSLQPRPIFANGSGRVQVNAGGSSTLGIIISGTSSIQVVFRAQGPNLQNYGISNYLPDPQIKLYNGSGTLIDSNNDWGSLSSGDKSVLSAHGLTPAYSDESALVETLSPGTYTVVMSDTSGTDSGVGLLEYFDIDSSTENRAINMSALGYTTGSGDEVLTGGFTISGSLPRTVYIHAWGDSLSGLVSGNLTDTELTVYNSTPSSIGSNDDWTSLSSALQARINLANFTAPGASSDSVVVLRLNPGSYSAQITGKSGASGYTLFEIDEF